MVREMFLKILDDFRANLKEEVHARTIEVERREKAKDETGKQTEPKPAGPAKPETPAKPGAATKTEATPTDDNSAKKPK